MRRIHTLTQRLTGSPVASAVIPLWRAPVDCQILAVRGLRTGGAAAAINARVGSDDLLSADLTCGNGVFASGAALTAAADVSAGDLVSVEVASGDATAVVIQVEYAISAANEL